MNRARDLLLDEVRLRLRGVPALQSNSHELVQLGRRHAPVEETEPTGVFHLAHGVAARYSDVARLMRLTPAAASSSTENDFPLIPAMKLTGFEMAAHTARTAARSGNPGAKAHLPLLFRKLEDG